ncbi:ABC transporter ATP-binding protein [Enemella sp. A6]|uniref:ABC transporter ATP-binding protein n=1 Tax=Enemella sp. A6 TaxID=3440152 RepID=UPI003EB91438
MSHELMVNDLSVRYGNAIAVDGLNLRVDSQQMTGLVGPNGAGKSSALLAIYGSIATNATVTLDGDDVARMSPRDRARRIALVPQGRQLFPKMTVRENLRVMSEFLKLPTNAVGEAMDRFPILHDRANAYAGVLSGGEQQMLVVTRALMANPQVLLLDEMMTGLAPRIVQELSATVRELADSGVAVLTADPSITPVRRIIDRGYVLLRGRVVSEADNLTDLDRQYQRAMGIIHREVEDAEAIVDQAIASDRPVDYEAISEHETQEPR